MNSVSTDAAQHIEQLTVGQVSNVLWLEQHACTITSSNFKKIISCQSPYTIKFLNSIFEQHDSVTKPCCTVVCGENESVASQECGLCLHQKYRFLGASTNCVVYDISTVDCIGLLQVNALAKYTLFI